MGRWAQQRRRGGEAPASSPPPAPITITEVDLVDPTHVMVFFDNNVTFDPAAGPSSEFDVGGATPTGSLSGIGSTSVIVELGSPCGIGDTWNVSSQPAWVVTAITTPATGTAG